MNFFIEGLQGSGKSTLANRIGEMHPEYTILREGDYSPLELSWCAYVTDIQYKAILAQYSSIRQEIEEKSHQEGDRWVICYTKIITDIPGFHKDLPCAGNSNDTKDQTDDVHDRVVV